MSEKDQAIVAQVVRIVNASLDSAVTNPPRASAIKVVGHEWAALLRILTGEGV